MKIFELLNNREISTLVWALLFFGYAFSKKDVRSAFGKVVKAFSAEIIFITFLGMTIYIFLMVLIFTEVGFWDRTAIKETIVWYVGSGFILFINSNRAHRDEEYLKSVLKDSLKFIVVYEFIFNLYAFSLPIELVIVPTAMFLAMISGFASNNPIYKKVKQSSDFLLTVLGIPLLIFTVYMIVIDFQNFASLKNLRDFLLPIVFTVSFLPYIYFLALYALYETIFNRIDALNRDAEISRFAKFKIFLSFNTKLRTLITFSKTAGVLEFQSQDEVLRLLEKYKKPTKCTPNYGK